MLRIAHRPSFALALALALALCAAAGAARADTFVVDTTASDDDGSCDPAPGDCTLPEAIAAASALPGRDAITFDPAVFPPGSPAAIQPAAALPPITDPAGTIVDGSGAGVILDGEMLAGEEHGLVIQSGAGSPLGGVIVQNLVIGGFPGNGLLVCGGETPDCDEDVTKTRILEVTALFNGQNGITVDGRANTGTLVADSTASLNGSRGINLNASLGQALTKAKIDGCTAENNDSTGINLNASGDNLGSQVVGSLAEDNDGTGINLNAGGDVGRARISNSRAIDNEGGGINVNAGGQQTGTKLSNVVCDENTSVGVRLNAGGGPVTGAAISGSQASLNGGAGFELEGGASKISKSVADGNGGRGIALVADGPSSGSRISRNQTNGNGGAGIFVDLDNTANRISGNTALSNGGFDLEDENPGCDANRWSKNVFDSANEACIE
jgi:CSLREA domain-containing protein